MVIYQGLSNGQLSDDWSSPCTGSSHNHTPSDASQHSSKLNDSRGQLSTGQLSLNSIDESRAVTGGEEFGASGSHTYRNGGSSVDIRYTGTTANSKPRRSYQSQRQKLHQSRTKASSSNLELHTAGTTELVGGRGVVQEAEEGSVVVAHSHSVDDENGVQNVNTRTLHSHSSSFDEASKTSVSHTSSLPVPYQFVTSPSSDSTERLVTTEEGEQYREIDIGAAIRKSQPGYGLGGASQGHIHSVDDQLNDSKGRPLMRYVRKRHKLVGDRLIHCL